MASHKTKKLMIVTLRNIFILLLDFFDVKHFTPLRLGGDERAEGGKKPPAHLPGFPYNF